MSQLYNTGKMHLPQTSTALHNELMNQKLWSGLTAALLVTALSAATSTHAESLDAIQPNIGITSQPSDDSTPQQQAAPIAAQTGEVVKVGEYQASNLSTQAEVIAKIQPHELAGRSAATVYVRNIPVITFVGEASSSPVNPVKVGEVEGETATGKQSSDANADAANPSDPVWRATSFAAKLNQMNRENIDANKISVSLQSGGNENRENYTIKVDGKELITFNAGIQLPDSTNNLAEDALQATNRLRRQMGNAAPLREIEGRPQPKPIAVIPKQFNAILEYKGMASWYGPGFHGNRSASGEVFNQDALTAAHRNLPFGTLVRVTNLDNNLSVVVRINDRGPFIGNRIIDLSAGAARVLGLISSGVAPVRVEVLGTQNAALE